MRIILGVLIITYLVGVVVALAPTITRLRNWDTPSELYASVMNALPSAFAWPVTAYHEMASAAAPTPKKEWEAKAAAIRRKA
jgi:hypothetical protein